MVVLLKLGDRSFEQKELLHLQSCEKWFITHCGAGGVLNPREAKDGHDQNLIKRGK